MSSRRNRSRKDKIKQKKDERNLMNEKHQKTFERDQVFQNTEESKKDQKMETRLIRKFQKRKIETRILPERTKLCFCQDVRIV